MECVLSLFLTLSVSVLVVQKQELTGVARCSITGVLITDPAYRTCTTCPAISLMPSKISGPPIAVEDSGLDKDHERFARPAKMGEELVQHVLDSCPSCIICGGRWIRAI